MLTLYKITCVTPNHFYVGLSADVDHRFQKHRAGKGAAFTRKHGAKAVDAIAVFDDESAAKRAESALVHDLSDAGCVAKGGGRTWSQACPEERKK